MDRHSTFFRANTSGRTGAIAGALILFVPFLSSEFATAQADLLPDIVVVESYLYDLELVRGRLNRRFLTLSNGTANIGQGPLNLVGVLPSNEDGTQDVIQVVYKSDGSTYGRAAGRFEFHEEHEHIHFEDWARYRLRQVQPDGGVGAVVAESDKVSYCILDIEPFDLSLPFADPDGRWFGPCDAQGQGISVGWVDVYEKTLSGQCIDVTDVTPGRYWLESEVDFEDNVLELDETNNVSRVQIAFPSLVIGPPANEPPDIQMLHPGEGDTRVLGDGTYHLLWSVSDLDDDALRVSVFLSAVRGDVSGSIPVAQLLERNAGMGGIGVSSRDVESGTYWVRVEVTDGGTTVDAWSDGTVSFLAEVPPEEQEYAVENQGFAARSYVTSNKWIAFDVSESGQGGQDLNADEDMHDNVVHVYDVGSGRTTSLGLAAGFRPLGGKFVGTRLQTAWIEEDLLLFLVGEEEQGRADLDFNGEVGGDVLHVHQLGSGLTTKRMVNLNCDSYPQLVGNRIACDPGGVVQIIEVGNGTVTSTGLRTTNGNFALAAERLAVFDDDVLHLYELGTGKTESLGLVGLGNFDDLFIFDGETLFFAAFEHGIDLDGVLSKTIAHLVDLDSGNMTNLGIAVDASTSAGWNRDYVVVTVPEGESGEDVNGDGDTLDSYLWVYERSTGRGESISIAVECAGLFLDDSRVAFRVSESQQGAVDLNEDGDAEDAVLHVYEFESRVHRNLKLAGDNLGAAVVRFDGLTAIGGDRLAFTVSEEAQGGRDLNGDGDALDLVVHILDFESGAIYNSRLAGDSLSISAAAAAFLVPESDQGGQDLNGDGDAVDDVLHVIPFGRPVPLFLRGDCNADGTVDISDPLANLGFQFVGTFDPPCRDALDFDDNGDLDLTDPIANLSHQFVGGPPPAAPGKDACGVDPTDDELTCFDFAACPRGG